MRNSTVGEALIEALERRGVDTVFGIPGVHTVELYRGLATSSIVHVTPRHEQGAVFMADGYARATGRPGVAFVITGPGVTNALTGMAQSRADSIPVLVVSGVNARSTLGLGHGHLHELPDQRATVATIALSSERVETASMLEPALDRAFVAMTQGRPGPAHVEMPTDVMVLPAALASEQATDADAERQHPDLSAAIEAIDKAVRPVVIAGGGALRAEAALRRLAEALDAPVVATINGRGLLHGHDLLVPASQSLEAIRALIADADLVIAAGTEFGPTDIDMNGVGGYPPIRRLIRIDVDVAQLGRGPAGIHLPGRCEDILPMLADGVAARNAGGRGRAAEAREAAWREIGPDYRAQVRFMGMLRDMLPNGFFVGDSTQPIYAANMLYDHDRVGGWFNAATGYGTLGYALPAAIGAAKGSPGNPVVCITGDGGIQFTLAELGTAKDAGLPVIVLVWNNAGYREIETSMLSRGVTPVGVSPSPPDFLLIAAAWGIPAERPETLEDLMASIERARSATGPVLIEIRDRVVLDGFADPD